MDLERGKNESSSLHMASITATTRPVGPLISCLLPWKELKVETEHVLSFDYTDEERIVDEYFKRGGGKGSSSRKERRTLFPLPRHGEVASFSESALDQGGRLDEGCPAPETGSRIFIVRCLGDACLPIASFRVVERRGKGEEEREEEGSDHLTADLELSKMAEELFPASETGFHVSTSNSSSKVPKHLWSTYFDTLDDVVEHPFYYQFGGARQHACVGIVSLQHMQRLCLYQKGEKKSFIDFVVQRTMENKLFKEGDMLPVHDRDRGRESVFRACSEMKTSAPTIFSAGFGFACVEHSGSFLTSSHRRLVHTSNVRPLYVVAFQSLIRRRICSS